MSNNNPLTLLNFSGGMDSTYVLYHWLKENPNETILLHHINLHHPAENRIEQEQTAVKNILNWLKRKGMYNFIYHQSSFDYGSLPRISIKDIQIVALFSGIILRTPQYKSINKILFSWHKGEVDDESIRQGYRVKAMFTALEIPIPEFEFPIQHLDRRDMAKKMPKELLRLTHSCRKPLPSRNCGICKTCKELKKAKILGIVGKVRKEL